MGSTITINEFIVYSTLIVLLVVSLTCLFLYLFRTKSRNKTSWMNHVTDLLNNDTYQSSHEGATESLLGPLGSSNSASSKKEKKSSNTSVASNTSKSKSKSKSSKSKSNSRSGDYIDMGGDGPADDINELRKEYNKKRTSDEDDIENQSHAGSDYSSQAASYVGTDYFISQNAHVPTISSSESDEAVLATFKTVLHQGIMIRLHTVKGTKSVSLTLVGNDLRWHTGKMLSITSKKHNLNICEIKYAESGKNTEVLKGKDAVDPDRCFSLMLSNNSLDFEASSKVERDALLQGFSLLLSKV